MIGEGGGLSLPEGALPSLPEYGGLVDISSSCRGKKPGSCELRRFGRSAEERGGEKQKRMVMECHSGMMSAEGGEGEGEGMGQIVMGLCEGCLVVFHCDCGGAGECLIQGLGIRKRNEGKRKENYM